MSDADLRTKLQADLGLADISNRTTPELLVQHQRHVLNKTDLGLAVIEVYPSGALHDGSTDDTSAIHAARDAAVASGKELRFVNGTYITSGLTFSSSIKVSFAPGAIIKKAATATSPAITVTGSGVTVDILDGELNCNKSGGAVEGGIVVSAGATLYVRNTYIHHSAKYGVKVTGSGSKAYCYRVRSDSHDGGFGTAGAGDGFYCETSGYLWCDDNCSAASNARSGTFILEGSADYCRVGGYTNLNGLAGFQLRSAKGFGGILTCVDNNSYGLFMGKTTGAVTGWAIDAVFSKSQGVTANNGAATAVQLNGVQNTLIGLVNTGGDKGYGVALAKGTDLTPSKYNSIGNIYAKENGDPALHFSGGASYNKVGNIYAYNVASLACILGESTTGNDFNSIDAIYAFGCTYGALRIDGGANNTIHSVISRDSYTTDTAYPGAVSFAGASTTENIVRWFEETATGTKPKYAVWADANAASNTVIDGRAADWQTSKFLDVNTGNSFTLSR